MMYENSDLNLLVVLYAEARKETPVHLLGALYKEMDEHFTQPVQCWISLRSKAMFLSLADFWTSMQPARRPQPVLPVPRLRPGLKQADFELPAVQPAGQANPSVSQARSLTAGRLTVGRPDPKRQLSLDLEQAADPAKVIAAVLARYQTAAWMTHAPLVAEEEVDFRFEKITAGEQQSN